MTAEDINGDLKRRQGGCYGRGGRMKIESDRLKSLLVFVMEKQQGLRLPFMLSIRTIKNGWTSWLEDIEDRLKTKRKSLTHVQGHADLVGGMKYRFDDLRNSLSVLVRVKQLCVWQ